MREAIQIRDANLNPSLDRERTLPSPWSNIFPARPEEQLYCCCGMVGGEEGGRCLRRGVIMFCVTMWPLFNLSPSGGGLPVGAGLGRRQPPRGAAGRGQQRCPVLVLLRHADVQGGPGAGENQRRAGPRQVTAPTHPPPMSGCRGRGGGQHSQPGWRGLRLTAVVSGGGGGERAAARGGPGRGPGRCGARLELPSRLRAAPRRALCRSQPAAFVAPGEPAVGAMLPAPPHSSPSAPHRAGGSQIRLPASGNPSSPPLPGPLLL